MSQCWICRSVNCNPSGCLCPCHLVFGLAPAGLCICLACSAPEAPPVDAGAPDAPLSQDAAQREPGMVIPPHDAGPPNLFFPCDDDAAGCWPRICPPWCEEGNLPPERNQ